VVTNTRKVLYTTAADQHHGVLLKIVANTGDISGNLVAIGKAHTGDLTKCGVRLLRGGGTHSSAHASLLRGRQIGGDVLQGVEALLECGSSGLKGDLLSALSDELVKSRHIVPPFLDGNILSRANARLGSRMMEQCGYCRAHLDAASLSKLGHGGDLLQGNSSFYAELLHRAREFGVCIGCRKNLGGSPF
jgi:hypothetical protein